MKPKIQLFSPNSQKKLHTASIFRQRATALVKDHDFWWGLFFLLCLAFIFVLRAKPSIPNYKVGDIAKSTVQPTRDIQVPDTAFTEKKREEAQKKVLAIYDYQPDLINSSLSRMHEIFTYLRNQNSVTPKNEKTPEEIADEIQSQFNVAVDPAFISFASQKGFSEDVENFLSQKLRKVMSQYIVSDRNVLFLYASLGLIVRNQELQREETMSIASVQDIRHVQESLNSELANEPGLSKTEADAYAKFLNTFVAPTLYFNSAETQSRLLAAGHNIEPVFYQIKKGKVIVREGDEITPTHLAQLGALRDAEKIGPPVRYSIGILILLIIYLIALKKYLNAHQSSDIKLRGKMLFVLYGVVLLGNILLVRLGLLIATSLSSTFESAPFNIIFAYQIAIPFAAGALLLTVLTDREISTIHAFGFSILVGVLTKGDFFLAVYCLASSVAAAFSIKRYYQRSALLRSCLWIWLANLLTVFTIYLLRESRLGWNEAFFLTACAFLSAILSAGVASILSPTLEWAFNITTDIKLLELSNLDLPVLRQLALEAPGTYHHSIVVGTIAEAAAEKVGANPLFLRVAALYHDIGKVRKADYYVENQRDTNKHDTLNPRMSALVIINHVKEGLEVAKMLRLPSDIAAMVPQHHGTRLITYFYKKAKDIENPEIEAVKEEDYRYPGPKPQSKEAAILMLADATEAASRTLTDPSPARLRNLVNTIFRAIFEDGQLDESNLTMKDLQIIADAFVRKLESIFHHRIAYPGYEFNRDEKAKDSGESQDVSEKMAT